MKKSKIVKEMKGKIEKSAIYDICKFYHHSREFLEYLENQTDKEFLELYGKNDKKWYYIYKFEGGDANDIDNLW